MKKLRYAILSGILLNTVVFLLLLLATTVKSSRFNLLLALSVYSSSFITGIIVYIILCIRYGMIRHNYYNSFIVIEATLMLSFLPGAGIIVLFIEIIEFLILIKYLINDII